MLAACRKNHYGNYELALSLGFDGLSLLPNGNPPMEFGISHTESDNVYAEIAVYGSEDPDVGEEVNTTSVSLCIGDIETDHMAYWNKDNIEDQSEAIKLGEQLAEYLNAKDFMKAILLCVANGFEYGDN